MYFEDNGLLVDNNEMYVVCRHTGGKQVADSVESNCVSCNMFLNHPSSTISA